MKFSNKCCADAWSVPSLIMSDMRAPRAGKAFNIHRIRLSSGFALFCPWAPTNAVHGTTCVPKSGRKRWSLGGAQQKNLAFCPPGPRSGSLCF